MYLTGTNFSNGVQIENPRGELPYLAGLARLAGDYPSAEQYVFRYKIEASLISDAARTLPNDFSIRPVCPQTTSGGYAVAVKCPENIRWRDVESGKKASLKIEIISYTPGTIYPEFLLADKALDIKVSKGVIQLTNLTADYLEIREITCYVNSELTTKKWGLGDYITLPPQSELKSALKRDDICRDSVAQMLRLSAVRLRDVIGKNLKFGVAVKYRRVGESSDHTLYQQRSYPLERLVKDTL